jgi:hypothetical protein
MARHYSVWTALLAACTLLPAFSQAAPQGSNQKPNEVAELRAALEALKSEYSNRVSALEARINQLEAANRGPANAANGTNAPSAANAASAANVPSGANAANDASASDTANAAGDMNAPNGATPADQQPVPADIAAAAAEIAASEAGASGGGGGVASNAPPPMSPAASGASAFNPAISMILAGNYASLSEDPTTYRIAGFIPNDGEVGPGERSFNLGESELTVAANIDPYFFGNVTASVTGDNEIEVEEAYVRTLALHNGLTAKAGRFFSGIGYLNEIHAHAWDFVDQPLIYQAFLGGQLGQDGVQVKWLAPTETFLEFGAETGNGQNFPGTRRDRNGLSGNALFVHVGGDIGDSTSWRSGVSWLDHRAEDRLYEDVDSADIPVVNAFTGKSRTWVVDGTLKWAPHGNVTRQQLKVQGEYMRRRETGDLAFDIDGANLSDGYRSLQSGWYLQTVYQFRPRWRIGGRYDALRSGSPRVALVENGVLTPQDFRTLLRATPNRFTTMLDWSPSEFSRLRAQFAWDDARDTDRDQQFLLQYIYSIGAHGAHKF